MLLKYFVSLTIFRKKLGSVLRCSSQWLCLYILSSKEANQLQVLYTRTLVNIQGNFSTEAAVPKCIPSIFIFFFLEICRRFRTVSEKLALENYVLAYHTVNKDHAEIL